MNPALERIKYIAAVVLYGTIGMFLRYVDLPSEIVAMCRGLIGSLFIFLYLKAKRKKFDRNNLMLRSYLKPSFTANYIQTYPIQAPAYIREA